MTAANGLPHNVGAQFQAKFDGRCAGCQEEVEAGDLMGYVDDTAVCDGCYNDADGENWAAVRRAGERARESEKARDPEAYAAREAAVTRWRDKVLAAAEANPGKEWVPSPGSTPGWVRVPPAVCGTCHLTVPCECEPPLEQEGPVPIEPGIQALMAAGMLQGQEPGGDGVCNATITDGSGKVTEVAIPVPVDPPTAKAPRKRASRAKPKPEAPAEDVPPVDSTGDGPAAALAQVRDANAARTAQLEANAKDWDPAAIVADVTGVQQVMAGLNSMGVPQIEVIEAAPAAAPAGALQAGLQSAVDSGAMTADQAMALGWVPPALTLDLPGTTPRTREPLEEFMANPATTNADIFLDALAAARSQPEEDAVLAALDDLAPYGGPADPEAVKKTILATIEDAIANHPRSLQKTIGPSEIGTECDHCLAAKLAGWDQVRESGAWLPTVGTAVHTWLEETFKKLLDSFGRPRYLTERKVAVGTIGGVEVTGSTDLVDLVAGMTWDWKIVGITTLKSAKVAPSQRYVVQQMLYARGWRRLGVLITHVGIAYLPRNEVSLRKAVLWTAPYDESIAVEALERADRIHANLKAMESISVETRDKYVTGLDRWRSWRENVGGVEKLVYGNAQEGQIECLDCARYGDYPADPAQAMKQLEGIL